MHKPKLDHCIAKYVFYDPTMSFRHISDAPLFFEPQHAGHSIQFLSLWLLFTVKNITIINYLVSKYL